MNARIVAFLFAMIPTVSFGQEIPGLSHCLLFDSPLEKEAFDSAKMGCDPLVFMLTPNPSVDSSEYFHARNELYDFQNTICKKRLHTKSDEKFLLFASKMINRKYLRRYSDPEPFDEVLASGKFNCVSGVALYATILDGLGYSFEIHETRFHVFLMVVLEDSSRMMIESTDRLDGLIADEQRATKHIERYLLDEQKRMAQGNVLAAPFDNSQLHNKISLRQLAGLHYYNIAVNFVNKKNYVEGLNALKKAGVLYPGSKRIADLFQYSLNIYNNQINSALNG